MMAISTLRKGSVNRLNAGTTPHSGWPTAAQRLWPLPPREVLALVPAQEGSSGGTADAPDRRLAPPVSAKMKKKKN